MATKERTKYTLTRKNGYWVVRSLKTWTQLRFTHEGEARMYVDSVGGVVTE